MRSARALEVYEKINCQFVYIDYIAKISPICKYIGIKRLVDYNVRNKPLPLTLFGAASMA